MKRRNLITITTILVLVVPFVAFADTTVPNTFTTGSVASAEEVNENFTALENGVNANETEIAANAQAIGGFSLFTPIAIGEVTNDGVVLNGFGDFAITKNGSSFLIELTGKPYNGTGMAVFVQLWGSVSGFARVGHLFDDILVGFTSHDGSVMVPARFMFVVYEF